MDNNFSFFGKRVLIVGNGISGKGAASALKQCGALIYFYENSFPDGIELIVLSPGIGDPKYAEYAKKMNVPIIGEIELGFMLDKAPIVAITGTNGKTTTTMLTGKMLLKSDLTTIICGNIGVSYASSSLLPHQRTAVEVSSFQLLSVVNFKPKVAVITNITPDHLDRHGSMEAYIQAKLKICAAQDENDYCIAPENVAKYLHNIKSKIILHGKEIGIFDGMLTVFGKKIVSIEELPKKEEHFIADALYASAAAMLVGAKPEAIKETLIDFKSADHRLSFEGNIDGKNFFNDSKGTNIGAAIAACKCMKGITALIAGGSDKGYDFDELFIKLPENIRYVICIGAVREKLIEAAERQGYKGYLSASGLSDAVHIAKTLDVSNVLLSPAAASFDCYEGYEKRGEHFKRLIRE